MYIFRLFFFKIVLRRLPASLTEDELKRILARGPELDFFRFVPADYRYVHLVKI